MSITPAFCCGLECGQLGSVGQHWSTANGGSIDTGTVRSGSRSFKFTWTSNAGQSTCVLAAATITVARFYIRFSTLPSANTFVAYVGNTATDRIGVAFKQSDSKLYCGSGTTIAFGATGVAVTTGVWYRIDVKLDQTSGAKACDAQVDGSALGQKTNTGTTAATVFTIGTPATITATYFYDDFIISNTSGDYPIGPGYVNHFIPASDGTHSTGTAGNFISGTAGANITDSTTDSHLLVDEVPLDGTTPTANDFIAIHNDTGATSNYVEHVFGPASGISTPSTAPRAVEVIAAHHQAGTGTGDCIFKLNDNGTEDAYLTRSAVAGVTTIKYARKHYATAPTGGAWIVTSGAGNFNNLRHRFGYSNDANPDQYFDCVMVEAEFAEVTGFTLAASPGNITVAGESANLTPSNSTLTANPGTITTTGQAATLRLGHPLTANPGSVTATGQTASLDFDKFPHKIAKDGPYSSVSGVFTPGGMPSHQAGDILVFFVETNNEAVTVSGWTEAGSSPAINSGTNPTRLTVFWKRATSGSTTAPSTNSLTDHAFGGVVSYRDCVASGDPFNITASSTGGTGTSVSIVGATTTVPNCLVLAAAVSTRDFAGNAFNTDWANASIAPITGSIFNNGTDDGTGGALLLLDGYKPNAGTYSATTVTQGTAVEYATWSGALKPASTYNLTTTEGTITLAGAAANLSYSFHSLTANPGSITVAGESANLTLGAASSTLTVTEGTITVAGETADLRWGYILTANPGTVTIKPANDVLLINNAPESFTLNFLIDLIPAASATNQQYDKRLTVDGQNIKVREWSFREEKDALTGKLDISLADISQRSLITRDSEITFEFGTIVNGVTTWADALVNTGQLDRTDYQISRQGLTPNDSFTMTTKPSLLVKLERTATTGYILYDPLKHEVNVTDWPKIKDTKGNTYTPVFIQQYFLTLHEIMYFVAVTICGFAGVETNIPDWYIGIVEFTAGELVMNTLGGLIGSFKPDFSTVKNYAGDDVLYIRDGTSGLPHGMPAPRSIGVANAKQIGMSADHNRADAILLTYIADLRSYDTFAVRTESKTEESGVGDEFTRTITVDTYTDFFRISQPDVPVRTILDSKDIDIYHMVKTYEVLTLPIPATTPAENPPSGSPFIPGTGTYVASLELIESSTETFRYDDVGLLLSRRKTAQKRLPDADNSFTIDFLDALDELETITYKQHPFRPMRTYVANRSIVTNGLIFVDADNPQLDQPFGQDANKVYQAGNVTTEQIALFGALRTYRETGKPLRNGRVRYHIIEIDQAAGVVSENYEEERDGDLGVKSTIQEPRQVYVLQDDDAVRTTDKILELHCGEAPVGPVGIPLARRVLLQENVFPNTVALQIIGIDETLTKGTAITAIGREQEDLGDYIIEARTFGERARGDDGKPGEAFMVLEVRQAN